MLAVNYRNLLTRMYPEIPKIFNLETAAYLYSSTVANVSVATFFVQKDANFLPSNYLIGVAVDDLKSIPAEVRGGFLVTSPIRTLQDLFEYEELVDPQVTFDYISWFEASQKLDPCDYLDSRHHEEVKNILKEGWSHGY